MEFGGAKNEKTSKWQQLLEEQFVLLLIREIVRLDWPTYTPNRKRINPDEAEDIAEEGIHIPRIGWLIGIWHDRPIGGLLDVQKWMARRDVRAGSIYCWSCQASHLCGGW